MKTFLMIVMLTLCCSGLIFSAAIVVQNTNDTGEGSLRVAIQAANSNPGPDVIEFLILPTDANFDAVNGYWTITVNSILPTVTGDSLTIDGFSQHRMSPDAPPEKPLIVISGYGVAQESHGLLLWGAYNTVKNICIGGFRGAQIWIKGQYSHHNSIEGCYVGVYPDGQTGFGDAQNPEFGVESSRGIYLSHTAYANRVGGDQDYMRNIICNMYADGILIDDSDGNVVSGNYIGVAKDGVTPLGNGWIDVPRYNSTERPISRYPGVALQAGSASNTIGGIAEHERNVICASGRAGIRIQGDGTDDNIVKGNYLGLGADGFEHTNLGNAEAGLKVLRGAQRSIIGGEEEGAGNVISGNGSSGVQIREAVSFTVIAGNLIGLTADETMSAPNAHNGIYLFGETASGFPQYNQIGPGNVIIPNGVESADQSFAFTWAAVRMDSAETSHNRVFGNWLGADKSGQIGSDYNSGVIIGSGAHDNIIGPENIIANTEKYGVWIRQPGTIRNRIRANSFLNNARQHIFLSDSGNLLIEPPQNLFVDASSVSGTCAALGKVELYIDDGETFVDSVFADGSGDFRWSGDTNNNFFLATVTDTEGNSSEFSASVGVPVELSAFFARLVNGLIVLNWRTESESNNLGFYVEKGSPEFHDIGFVGGQGTTAKAHSYSFVDSYPTAGAIRYRLRQVDFDGATTHSQAIAAVMAIPERAALQPPFPNPFNSETVFLLDVQEETDVFVDVYNIRGEHITSLFSGRLEAGSHRLTWNGRNIKDESAPTGMYLIRARIKGQTTLLQKAMFVR